MQMHPEQPRLTSKDALATPEILFSIGRFLSRQALARCLLVCRYWHFTLKPCLWEEIEVTMDTKASPQPEIAQANASFIRKLTLWSRTASDTQMAFTYPHLSDLFIAGPDFGDRFTTTRHNSLLVEIIQRHRETLRNVVITLRVDGPVFEALADCPRLETLAFSRNLELNGVPQWMQSYQKLRSQLHAFDLFGPHFSDQGPAIMTPTLAEEWRRALPGPNRIQDLTLARSVYGDFESLQGLQAWMVQDCPDLVRLKWYSRSRDASGPMLMRKLVTILHAGRHSRLEDVSMPFDYFDDQDFEDLLKSLHRLTKLDLSWTQFQPTSWEKLQAMPRHLETLVALNLDGCSSLPGSTVMTLLCYLPNLKVFKADDLYDQDLEAESGPWACIDLERLTLSFWVPSGDLSTKPVQDFFVPDQPAEEIKVMGIHHSQEKKRGCMLMDARLRFRPIEESTRTAARIQQRPKLWTERDSVDAGTLAPSGEPFKATLNEATPSSDRYVRNMTASLLLDDTHFLLNKLNLMFY